ncbi:MFS transporter superfamily [Arabidopsis suecica]|uniref:MFS transporter superfamily n=1 Tax=Arabidopsis suecica TaxID=45249 RepID=A0A8T2B4L5_ARASU|nr:MFS transporter superfamily [Arabidopsis suecica]
MDTSIVAATTNPKGKYFALAVCWLLGIGCLLAWNSMLTIVDYYAYLFPRYHPSNIITIIYQSFAIGALSVLVHKEARLNTRRRNLIGYSLFSLGSLAVLVLELATSGRGGIGSFIGVCVISAAFGLGNAHVLGGMIGDLSMMTPKFLQSFLAGLAASGALTSGLRLVTKAAFGNSKDGLRKGATLFFAVSASFELVCVLLYAYVFPRIPIVKYYRGEAILQGAITVAADLAAGGGTQVAPTNQDVEAPRYVRLLNKRDLMLLYSDLAVTLFSVYVLTFSIFPGFLSEDTGNHSLGDWYALVLIAVFNVSDLVGRYVPVVKKLKMKSRRGLLITSLGRLLLIPAFYITGIYGSQGWMIFLMSVLGLSNGYLTVCVITSAPHDLLAPEQNALGNLLVFFISGGMFVGVACDWLWLIGKDW